MRVEYKEKALDQLEKLPRDLKKRITDKIDYYASKSDPFGAVLISRHPS